MSTDILDTHAHLTSPEFAHDLDEVLARASSAGVQPIIVVSESISNAVAVLNLYARYNGKVRAAIGLHPANVAAMSDADAEKAVSELSELLVRRESEIVAVGEIGLDHTPRVLSVGVGDVRGRQERVFRACLALARKHALPVSVHSRGAGRHAANILADTGMSERAVLHAFDGRAVYAERAAKDGCALSVPPSIVRSAQMQNMVKRVAIDHLLIETDSPVLGVDPAKRNEPADAVRAIEMIAAIKGIDVEECRRIIDRNARAMFPRVFLQL